MIFATKFFFAALTAACVTVSAYCFATEAPSAGAAAAGLSAFLALAFSDISRMWAAL